MRPFHRLACIVAIFVLSIIPAAAQTLSNCRQDIQFNPNIKPGVVGIEFSRDEQRLVAASSDAKVRYIDVATGKIVQTLTGHTNSLYKAVYSPDEKLLLTSSRDHTARLWNAQTGELLHILGGFRCSVKAAAFSPDGRIAAASGNDGMLKLFDVTTGRELKSLVHKDSRDIDMSIYSFVFTPDGKRIFAGNGDGTISEWEVSTGRELSTWKAGEPTQIMLAISDDGTRLASILASTVRIWDTRTHHQIAAFEMPRVPNDVPLGNIVTFSRDGKLLAASSSGLDSKGTSYLYVQAVVWEVKTGKRLFVFTGQKFDIQGLRFTRKGDTLLTGSIDGTIDFWDTKTGKLKRTLSVRNPPQ